MEDGVTCATVRCAAGYACVHKSTGAGCMAIDPKKSCDNVRCRGGQQCQYESPVCMADALCFAQPRCVSTGSYIQPEQNPYMISNDAPPGGLIGGASASPKCAGKRNERYYQCKPCESTCTDWVLKKKPSCPNQKCVPGCACIPNWHRKNQPGYWTGTCVRPTWCNPITQTKTVTKTVQPVKTVPGPPKPVTCSNVQCGAGSTCQMQSGKPVCVAGQTNPCATTVCTYGAKCVVQSGKAVCVKDTTPASPSYPGPAPATPSYPGPARPPSGPSSPSSPSPPAKPGYSDALRPSYGPVPPPYQPPAPPSYPAPTDAPPAYPSPAPSYPAPTDAPPPSYPSPAPSYPSPAPSYPSPAPPSYGKNEKSGGKSHKTGIIGKVVEYWKEKKEERDNRDDNDKRRPYSDVAGPRSCGVNEQLTQCGGCESQCQAGNPPKPVPICTRPKPCARQCKCKSGFVRVNKVCTAQRLCGTNYRPKLTVKTKTVVKTLPPKVVVGPPRPQTNPCSQTNCGAGATCANQNGVAVCTGPPADPCGHVVCEEGKTCQVQDGKGVCLAKGQTYTPQKDAPSRGPCLAKCRAGQRCVWRNDDNSCYNPPCPPVPSCV
ncbi:unnamed protein product [Nippostrongylus brasiliensis]|uniref:TIL domain-containing protein n=1 Tax=Nippostrongylus brasiliensis TaxID=27835 RepID=A0A0N4Y0Q5_NIPBR|nr:unnamed protein product [Nippostrongylus brasiliensis]